MKNSRRSLKLYAPDRSELMEVTSLTRDGDNLLIRGKIMGSMPMTAVIRPDQARNGLGLLSWRLAFFLLTFFFRRGSRDLS